ncbi:Protein kinase-like domain protein [Metarhizium brunneum]
MGEASDSMLDAEYSFSDVEPRTANPVLNSYETNDMTYEFTATSFKKTSRLPFNHPYRDGTTFTWFRPWNHERITNEAKALKLVSQQTTIPVPKLLEHGKYMDGRRYLVTELIDGVTLDEFPSRPCSKPKGEKHADGTSCKICSNLAYSNALKFIEDTVLPQLARLKSQNRGIDGFVMPPNWLDPARPPWKGKKHWETLPLEKPEYVFQHGDIAAHNLMMDPQTLQPKALIDWEYAGYFPPGMERWPGTLDPEAYYNRGTQLAPAIAEFFPTEYLECYKQWSNKAELGKLIEIGQLPHPNSTVVGP